MATTILDKGAVLQLTTNGQVRNITKVQIVEVAIIKTNIIKIDLRMGPLDNIYIPFGEVSIPVAETPEALRDIISSYLPSTSENHTTGGATEVKQTETNGLLTGLNKTVFIMNNALNSLETKLYQEPILEDDSGANIIYKGYAAISTAPEQPFWAIQRIQKIEGINIVTWANGNRDQSNKWTDREALAYK